MIIKRTDSITLAVDMAKLKTRVIDEIEYHYPEIGIAGIFEAKHVMKILKLNRNKLYWLSTLRRFCTPVVRACGRSGKNKFDLAGLFKLAFAQELQELGYEMCNFDKVMDNVEF